MRRAQETFPPAQSGTAEYSRYVRKLCAVARLLNRCSNEWDRAVLKARARSLAVALGVTKCQ